MKYHIEGEISRITLNVVENVLSLRLKPSPEYIRKDGDVERVVFVSDDGESLITVRKENFDSKDIEIPKRCSAVALLLSCKANRNCIRLEFDEEKMENSTYPTTQPVSLSVV